MSGASRWSAGLTVLLLLTLGSAVQAQTGGAGRRAGPAGSGEELSGSTSQAVNQCGVCHPSERVAYEVSVHAADGVSCHSCHGGDPTTTEVERAHREPFTGRPSRREIPDLCASCHSDLERMRPFNLPTDQLALYRMSAHGKRLAAGDDRVAVCSDCHEPHGTLPASDPRSRINRRNEPATCGSCHDDEEAMAPYGGTSKPFASYMNSVHARKLFQEGNENAPVCVDCHGVHGAAPPEYSNVDRVCGRCHTTTRHYFVAGSHAPERKNPDLPECSSCHGNHAIAASLDTDFASLCLTCHDEDSGPAAIGDRIEVLVRTAADEIDQADSLVAEAEKIPLDVRDHRARLLEARTYLTEVLPVSHAVSIEPVEELTRRGRSIASEVESEIHGKLRDHLTHRFGLVAFWFYVLLTAGILADLRRQGGGS